MTFAKNLKKARQSKGLTQKELAEKVGLKRSTIAGYESKGQEPSFNVLKELTAVLECSLDALLGITASDNSELIRETTLTMEDDFNPELSKILNELKKLDKQSIDFCYKMIKLIRKENFPNN